MSDFWIKDALPELKVLFPDISEIELVDICHEFTSKDPVIEYLLSDKYKKPKKTSKPETRKPNPNRNYREKRIERKQVEEPKPAEVKISKQAAHFHPPATTGPAKGWGEVDFNAPIVEKTTPVKPAIENKEPAPKKEETVSKPEEKQPKAEKKVEDEKTKVEAEKKQTVQNHGSALKVPKSMVSTSVNFDKYGTFAGEIPRNVFPYPFVYYIPSYPQAVTPGAPQQPAQGTEGIPYPYPYPYPIPYPYPPQTMAVPPQNPPQ